MQPLAKNIWINGELTAWENATVHVMSHALHYGTSVFEGIRVYDTPNGPCGFRLTDHVRRLFDSARIYHFPMPYTEDELVQACKEVVRAEGLRSAYLRPLAFLGECGMGVSPSAEAIRSDVMISAFAWGAYLGEEALEKGVDACISSWNRVAPNTVPAGAKAGQPFAPGANPMHKRDSHGAIASLSSVSKLPFRDAQDGISNTFSIIPSALGKEDQVFFGDIDLDQLGE